MAKDPIEEPNFIVNQVYRRRRDIHSRFGGNWQGGICPSATFPFIFIFTGSSGDQHGYKDMWENEFVFSYTGEGQMGDMQFTRGNLALRDHVLTGKRVFLFEQVSKGFVRFVSEMTYFDCDYYPTFDTNGQMRMGIKFFLKRAGVEVPYDLRVPSMVHEPLTLEQLKPTVTERSGLVLSRVGQGAYRKSIINRWLNQCAVTGFKDSRILVASHIHPWKDASNDERLDVNNGILLSPTYDALFDKHLITFENSGDIVLSESLPAEEFDRLGVSGREKIRNFNRDNYAYLEKHRTEFGQA